MDIEIAWAAGFFDGEGSTCITAKGASVRMSLPQAEPTNPERFIKALGVGSVSGPSKRGHWTASINGKEALVALGKLWPYLGEPKKLQATLVLNEVTKRLDGRPFGKCGPLPKTHCPQGHEYNEENSIILPKGEGKRCKKCKREQAKNGLK